MKLRGPAHYVLAFLCGVVAQSNLHRAFGFAPHETGWKHDLVSACALWGVYFAVLYVPGLFVNDQPPEQL